MSLPKSKFFLLPLALAVASAILRFSAFRQTDFANGWDSYFYLVQLKSLEETGQMHSPEASLFYPYLQICYWLAGHYVLAMKVGAATLCGVFTLLLCRSGASFPLLGAWSLFSPQLTYFAAQYPKNLLGLVLFLAFVRSLGWAASKSRAWFALPVFLLVLNYFGHRLMFGLAVAYLFLWLFFRLKNRFPQNVFSQKNLVAGGIAIGAFVLAGVFFPGLAQVADLGRLSGALCWQPQLAPWSFVQTFGLERIGGWWVFEVLMVTVCPPLLWFRRVKWFGGLRVRGFGGSRVGVEDPVLFWLCGLLLFPFLEWSLTGVAWRLFLVFVLLAPLAFDFQNVPQKASLTFFLALVAASFFSWKSYSPSLHDPDYALFKKVTGNVQRFLPQLPDPDSSGTKLAGSSAPRPELFIAHNALAEYFTFSTGTDAMPWLPEYAVDSAQLWRIAAGVHEQTLRYFAGQENGSKIKKLGGRYFLLPEHVWQSALTNARAEGDEHFLQTAESWLNPHRTRPAFLLKRKE
ncbi:MAG: hypothetical protein ACKVUS_00170 [Saprospiraceae bacterium]